MTQSRTMSLVEAATNVVIGYALAVATQIVVFPWFGIDAAFGEHLAIGLAFVGISLARGYLLRRLFEQLRARRVGDARHSDEMKRACDCHPCLRRKLR